MPLKGYTLRKNGKHMRNRRVKFVLSESAVLAVMERAKCSQADAEEALIEAMFSGGVECLGLVVTLDGKVEEGDTAGLVVDAPLVYP